MTIPDPCVLRLSLIMSTERKKKSVRYFLPNIATFMCCEAKESHMENIGLKPFLLSWYLWFSDVSGDMQCCRIQESIEIKNGSRYE